MLGRYVICAAVALGLGFLAGRASVRVDDQQLADSLAVYREHRADDARIRDSLRSVVHEAQARAQAAEADAARWRAAAATRTAVADRHRARADSLWRLLGLAGTAGDSLPLLIQACTELRSECDQLRAANGALLQAAAADSLGRAALRSELGAHQAQRDRDSTRLAEADGLVRRLERNVRGCRIPLVGLPCPEGLTVYELGEGFRFGGTMPVKVGLVRVNLGVVVRP